MPLKRSLPSSISRFWPNDLNRPSSSEISPSARSGVSGDWDNRTPPSSLVFSPNASSSVGSNAEANRRSRWIGSWNSGCGALAVAAAVGRAHVADAGAGREGRVLLGQVVRASSLELEEDEATRLEDCGPVRSGGGTCHWNSRSVSCCRAHLRAGLSKQTTAVRHTVHDLLARQMASNGWWCRRWHCC